MYRCLVAIAASAENVLASAATRPLHASILAVKYTRYGIQCSLQTHCAVTKSQHGFINASVSGNRAQHYKML